MKTISLAETERIKSQYLKPPTPLQIQEFIAELQVTITAFEKYYGIPTKTLFHVFNGNRDLPVRFWPVIYEKIVPTYGIGYKKRVTKSVTRKRTKKKAAIPSTRTQIPQNSIISEQDVSQVQNEKEGLNHPLSGLLE